MTDESVINLSDSTKSEVRRYAMACGFALIALWSMILLLSGMNEVHALSELALCISLLFVGVTLALLHKRDQIALLFIAYGCLLGVYSVTAYPHHIPVTAVFILMGIMFLFTRNEQRISVSVVFLLTGLSVFSPLTGDMPITILRIIQAIFCTYCALCLGIDRFKLPFTDMLMADEAVPENDGNPVHFKITGAVIGYMMFAAVCLQYVLHYAGIIPVTTTLDSFIDVIAGFVIIISGFIMLVAGRMRYTPFMFIFLGILTITTFWIPTLYIAIGLGLILLGVVTMLRKDPRILAGIAFIVYGLTMFCSIFAGFDTPTISLILNAIPFLICVYISFALCSDGRLKLI